MPECGDVIWTYEHEVIATLAGPVAVLKCARNGECVYVGRDGCTIQDRAPTVCRAFDCRDLYRSKTSAERRAIVNSGVASKEIFSAGAQAALYIHDVSEKLLVRSIGNAEQVVQALCGKQAAVNAGPGTDRRVE
jgi:Fe-S-cluster containining protein